MNLLLDNSALSLLHCKRRFQLTVLDGKRSIDNAIASMGSAVHIMLEHLDKGSSVEDTLEVIRTRYPEGVDIPKVLSTVTLYKASTKLPPPIVLQDNHPAVEIKFSFPYGRVLTPSNVPIDVSLVGTIDRIHIDPPTDTLVILDYKTGVAATDYQVTKSMSSYDLSFQLPFYVHALKQSSILPAIYKDYLENHKYRTEFHFLFYNTNPPTFKRRFRPAFNSDFIDREVPTVINARIREAIEVAQLTTPAVHDGMNVYGACSYCPFKPGCLSLGTEQEIEFLSRFEVKPYDPLSFR